MKLQNKHTGFFKNNVPSVPFFKSSVRKHIKGIYNAKLKMNLQMTCCIEPSINIVLELTDTQLGFFIAFHFIHDWVSVFLFSFLNHLCF